MVGDGVGADVLVDELGDLRLHRGLERFVIERHGCDVFTAWEGRSPTTQKPSVAAARIVAGAIEVAAPSLFVGSGATQTIAKISADRAVGTADAQRGVARLESPEATVTLYRDRPPEAA